MTKLMLTLTIAMLLGASTAVLCQGKGNGNGNGNGNGGNQGSTTGDLPVTSTIHDIDATGTDSRIKSDGAPYVSFKQGNNVVQSQITGGLWELDTRTSTTRKVFVDFRDPVGSSAAPFQTALLPVRFLSQCGEPYNVNLRLLSLGQTVECGLNFGFTHGGKEYGVRMRPHLFPVTTAVAWTCTSVNLQGTCSAWEAGPNTMQADGSYKAVAQLFLKASKPKDSEVVLGNYYLTFRITFTAP